MLYLHLQRLQVFNINVGTDGCWIRYYVKKTAKGTFKVCFSDLFR